MLEKDGVFLIEALFKPLPTSSYSVCASSTSPHVHHDIVCLLQKLSLVTKEKKDLAQRVEEYEMQVPISYIIHSTLYIHSTQLYTFPPQYAYSYAPPSTFPVPTHTF